MHRIRIYRHPECARCARIAATHHRLDVLRRISDTTEAPPTGPLRRGEIVVEDLATGALARGADAFALITRQNPLYAPARWLLRVPAFRRKVEAEVTGCADGSCDTPPVRA